MNHEFRIMVIFLFLILTSLFFIHPVIAQENSFGKAQISPSSPLYFLIAIQENFEMKFSKIDKAGLNMKFSNQRIKETNSLVNTSHEDLIAPTLERYWDNIGKIRKNSTIQDEIVAASVTDIASQHTMDLLGIYDQVSLPEAKRSIRYTVYKLSLWQQQLINKLNDLSKFSHAEELTKSKLAACAFLIKEASSSALNETEREVLASRANECKKLSL